MKHPANGRKFWGGAGIAALMLAVQVTGAAQFSAPDIEVDEGDKAVFQVTLPDTYDFDVRFPYETRDGSAEEGKHYEAKEGYLMFSAGTQSAKVEVQTRVSPDAVTRDFKLVLIEKQRRWGDSWSAAWAVIYLPDVPSSKDIRAEIRDTHIGTTGSE